MVSASGFDYSLCYGITGSRSSLYGTHTRYHDYSNKHLHVSVTFKQMVSCIHQQHSSFHKTIRSAARNVYFLFQ